MSDKKFSENDPERTLLTLDQLSQTIEVMTNVVNRLRQHLSQQLRAKREAEERERAEALKAEASEREFRQLECDQREYVARSLHGEDDADERERFIVEITQTETDIPEEDRILH